MKSNLTDSYVQRYKTFLDNPRPTKPEELKQLTEELYARLLKKEEDDIAKIHQVLNFAKDDDCAWRGGRSSRVDGD